MRPSDTKCWSEVFNRIEIRYNRNSKSPSGLTKISPVITVQQVNEIQKQPCGISFAGVRHTRSSHLASGLFRAVCIDEWLLKLIVGSSTCCKNVQTDESLFWWLCATQSGLASDTQSSPSEQALQPCTPQCLWIISHSIASVSKISSL